MGSISAIRFVSLKVTRCSCAIGTSLPALPSTTASLLQTLNKIDMDFSTG